MSISFPNPNSQSVWIEFRYVWSRLCIVDTLESVGTLERLGQRSRRFTGNTPDFPTDPSFSGPRTPIRFGVFFGSKEDEEGLHYLHESLSSTIFYLPIELYKS